MTWFVFSLISIIALALAELIQQHLLNGEKSVDERTSVIVTFSLQSLLVLPIIFMLGQGASLFNVFKPEIFPYLVLSSLAASAGMVFYLKSFRVNNISFSTIFISFSVVISTTLGVIFFKESTTILKLVGILLVIASVASLNLNNKSLEKNHLYGLLAGIFFGLTYTVDKLIVLNTEPLAYLFWSFTIVVLVLFVVNPRPVIVSIRQARTLDFKHMFISGLGYLIYNYSTFMAYKTGGEVGRVDAINNSQVFLIILVEYFIFKHQQDIKRKLITAIIAFAGVFILGNF